MQCGLCIQATDHLTGGTDISSKTNFHSTIEFYNKMAQEQQNISEGTAMALQWCRQNGGLLKDTVQCEFFSLILRWGLVIHFCCSINFLVFQNHKNNCYLLNIIFIFDRCHYSWAAVQRIKYKCDSKYLTVTFSRLKISLIGNRGLNPYKDAILPV